MAELGLGDGTKTQRSMYFEADRLILLPEEPQDMTTFDEAIVEDAMERVIVLAMIHFINELRMLSGLDTFVYLPKQHCRSWVV